MRRLLLGVALVIGLAFVVGLGWFSAFRQRASQAEVTRAAYAQFGPGPRIICVAQTGNGDRWNCLSLRWGGDPACRQATVSLTGTIHISRQTVTCER
jgi:multidrug efflux pump subunit AcrA (membrane-fusion protein)